MSSKKPRVTELSTENDKKIIITNERIVNFYNNNKQLDFERINLLYIELFENIMSASFDNPSIVNHIMLSLNNQTNDISNIMSLLKSSSESYKNELTNIKEVNILSINNIKSEMEQIKTSIISLNNLVTTKLYETKDIYIKDVKEVLKNSENNSIINLSSTIEKYNNMLTEKIILNINDVIPKTQSKQYDELLNSFKKDMLLSLNSIKENDPNIILEKLSLTIESKYNTLLSSLHENMTNNISQSEIRLTHNLNQLRELSTKNSIIQESINEELTRYINKSKTISGKGLQSENILYNLLTKEYTSAEIINTTGNTGQGDIIIKRKDKVPILIENKNYTTNVKKEEVDKFIRDVTNCDYNGIFISQNSGIIGKDNFQIDLHDKNILIYIHCVNYDISKINLAINTIDLLHDKLISLQEKNASIPMDVLREINSEYQMFIIQREKLINGLKDYYKKTFDQYSNLTLPCLDKFISGYYANTKKKLTTCDICKKYESNNLKSLARHKQSCKKKCIKTTKTETTSEEILDDKEVSLEEYNNDNILENNKEIEEIIRRSSSDDKPENNKKPRNKKTN